MLLTPIDNYCERTGVDLFSEPTNAVSNLSFFIAAWLLLRLYRSGGRHNPEALILISLVALVGAGSTLFHTFANQLAMLGDIIPIAMFTFYYFWLALRLLIGLSWQKTLLWMLLFAVVASQTQYVPEGWRFNGSVDYFPCLGALLLIGGCLRRLRHPAALLLLKAAALFVLSLTFRSIDMEVCASFPIGTHFLWHILNGAVLYLLTKAIIRVE